MNRRKAKKLNKNGTPPVSYTSKNEQEKQNKLKNRPPFVVYESTFNVKFAKFEYQTLFFGEKEVKEGKFEKRAFYGITHLLSSNYDIEVKNIISQIQNLIDEQSQIPIKKQTKEISLFLDEFKLLESRLKEINKQSEYEQKLNGQISPFITPLDILKLDENILKRNKIKMDAGVEILENRLSLSNFIDVPMNLKSNYLDGLRMGQWMNESNIDSFYDLFVNRTDFMSKTIKKKSVKENKIRKAKFANYVVGVSRKSPFIIVAEGVTPAFRKHFQSNWYVKIEKGEKVAISSKKKNGIVIPNSVGGTSYEIGDKNKINFTSTDVNTFQTKEELQRKLIILQFTKENLNLFPILDFYNADLDFFHNNQENRNNKRFVYFNSNPDQGELKEVYSSMYLNFKNSLLQISSEIQSWYPVPKKAENKSKQNWSESLKKEMEERSVKIKSHYVLFKDYFRQQVLMKFDGVNVNIEDKLTQYMESKKPKHLKN